MENRKQQQPYKFVLIGASLLGLALIYFFQRMDYLNLISRFVGGKEITSPNLVFAFNKTLRLILNDLLCFLLIYTLFNENKYLRIAFLFFCFELFFVLPLYLIVKLSLEGNSEISSPLLSQIHRLIVNPMLMLLLIVAFYYQRFWSTRNP